MDVDLSVSLAKRYEPLTRVVSNYIGERLFSLNAQVVRELFMLTYNKALLERIDLSKF